jgi:hypothetical protein
MIMSVSILSIGIGAATPVNVVNLSMHSSFLLIRAFGEASLCGRPRGAMRSGGQAPTAVLKRRAVG